MEVARVPTTGMPRIGVAVIVIRDGLVLIGRRRSTSHGDATWQFPGGHLEWGESIAQCALREVAEETGLAVTVIGLPTCASASSKVLPVALAMAVPAACHW